MEITEVRILPKSGANKKLRAYAAVTFDDCFVVRNLKVIEGGNGVFVAMPSRKMRIVCGKCNRRVDLARYCGLCGAHLRGNTEEYGNERDESHYDIAHPINQVFRDYLQRKVIETYKKHVVNAVPNDVLVEAEQIISEG